MSATSRIPAALLAALATLAACGGTPPPSKLITFGAVIDRTGNNSEPSWAQAIRLAEAHANAALAQDARFNGYAFRILIGDSANEPKVALRRAADLVKNQGAKGLILDSSQNDIAINRTNYDIDTANDLAVPLQCSECTAITINDPTSTDPALQNRDKWNFRAVASSRSVAKVMVRSLLTEGPNSNGDVNYDRKFKLAVYVSNEIFGQSFSGEIKQQAEALAVTRNPPLPVVVEQSFHPRDAEPNSYEWRADLDRLSDAAPDGIPDAIIVATFAQYHAAFVRSFKGSYGIKVMHAHNFRIQSGIQSLGTLGDGEEGVSGQLLNDGASGERFAAEFREASHFDPAFLDAVYYDNAITLMLASLIAAGPSGDPADVTGAQVRDALTRTSDSAGAAVGAGKDGVAEAFRLIRAGSAINYEGASGPMDYDSSGSVVERLAHYQAKNGGFVELATFDCIQNPNECPQR